MRPKPNNTKHMPKDRYFQRVQAVSKQVERVRKSSLEYAQVATPGWKKILRAKKRKKQARKGHHFTKAEYAQYGNDHIVFSDLDGLFYRHETVNHSAGEYARGAASTNSIESVWAVLKRGLHGVYHHASKKHLFRYVDEFTFRLNEGNVERHTLERLDSFVDGVSGKRLTYARLIA